MPQDFETVATAGLRPRPGLGFATKVGGVRIPVAKYEAVMAVFAKEGLSFSEGMERVIDTQILRTR